MRARASLLTRIAVALVSGLLLGLVFAVAVARFVWRIVKGAPARNLDEA
jgi:hypothetical protein